VAVVVILRWEREKTPPSIGELVRVAVETGAALAGTLQTENVGLEKVICNVVSNPNIRFLVVCGPESPGHLVGETILALQANGVDDGKRIIGSNSPAPYLYNLPIESIERFRQQITVIDLIDEGSPDVLRQAVWSCYQEEPTPFRDYTLHDPGAFPEPPLSGKITWRVRDPVREPKDEGSRARIEKARGLMEQIKRSVDANKRRDAESSTELRKEG
jgi:tetrahydromethanopterin S-methyltransferase subunit A